MSESQSSKTSITRRLWNRIAKQWVAEIPDDIACCELDCRELDCEQSRWEACKHRLHYMAAMKARRNRGVEGQGLADAQDPQTK